MLHRKWVWPLVLVFGMVVMAYAADSTDPAKDVTLRHVVCFKFKDGTPQEKIDKAVESFKALQDKIPVIAGFEWGLNNSPEKLDQGVTHCFILTFKSVEDRDTYLPHPAHKEFGKGLGDIVDKVFVADFVVQ